MGNTLHQLLSVNDHILRVLPVDIGELYDKQNNTIKLWNDFWSLGLLLL